MAISISEQYPGKTAGNTTNYPLGEARNVTTLGDGTGTPWEQAIVNDDQGFKQALLAAAGLTPSGTPDTAIASQYLQAVIEVIKNYSPGYSQVWTDVKSSRQSGQSYPNNTMKQIHVQAVLRDTIGVGLTVTVGGKKIINLTYDIPPGGFYPLSFPVPAGMSYSIFWAGTGDELVSWWELK